MRVVHLLVEAVVINNVATLPPSDYLRIRLTVAFAHCEHEGLGFPLLPCDLVYLPVRVAEDAVFFLKRWFVPPSTRARVYLCHHGDS